MPAPLASAKSGLPDLADYAKSPVSWQDFLPGDGRLRAGIDLITSQKIAGWHNFSVPHSRFQSFFQERSDALSRRHRFNRLRRFGDGMDGPVLCNG
jgi:hypothetical protein